LVRVFSVFLEQAKGSWSILRLLCRGLPCFSVSISSDSICCPDLLCRRVHVGDFSFLSPPGTPFHLSRHLVLFCCAHCSLTASWIWSFSQFAPQFLALEIFSFSSPYEDVNFFFLRGRPFFFFILLCPFSGLRVEAGFKPVRVLSR